MPASFLSTVCAGRAHARRSRTTGVPSARVSESRATTRARGPAEAPPEKSVHGVFPPLRPPTRRRRRHHGEVPGDNRGNGVNPRNVHIPRVWRTCSPGVAGRRAAGSGAGGHLHVGVGRVVGGDDGDVERDRLAAVERERDLDEVARARRACRATVMPPSSARLSSPPAGIVVSPPGVTVRSASLAGAGDALEGVVVRPGRC